MPNLDQILLEKRPLVAGAISEPAALAAPVSAGECDVIELRLDSLGTGESVENFCQNPENRFPILLTARHPAEGGAGDLSTDERSTAFSALLDSASAIDIEIRSIEELSSVWSAAGERGITRVASFHDFEGTPAIDELIAKVHAAAAAGADIAKFAFQVAEPRGLAVVSALLRTDSPIPLSVMGMGPLAAASRVLAMQLGSVLNYGYLGDTPTAPGQWPARLLKDVLAASS